jgi:hypothetical protein
VVLFVVWISRLVALLEYDSEHCIEFRISPQCSIWLGGQAILKTTGNKASNFIYFSLKCLQQTDQLGVFPKSGKVDRQWRNLTKGLLFGVILVLSLHQSKPRRMTSQSSGFCSLLSSIAELRQTLVSLSCLSYGHYIKKSYISWH